MAMKMSSSQHEMVHEQRPVMSADLFLAAMKGDGDVLIQRLGLLEQQEVKVTIEASHSAPEEIKTKHLQTVQSELQSTTHFGDTLLHLLVTQRHNELALKVFERDMSLLKAQNKMLETPLYCTAKVGNEEVIHKLILIDPVIVKAALKQTNENGDTALHVAAQHGHTNVSRELVNLDPKVACTINKGGSTPLNIGIVKGYTKMVQTMLEVDPTLACTKFPDGMFPVHVSASMGNKELVMHFMEKYPDYAELLDACGRNLFHIAAEKNLGEFIRDLFKETSVGRMIITMNNATDYEGNTPLHVAAMKGHLLIMMAIRKNKMRRHIIAETIRNNEGLTPFEVSKRQQLQIHEDIKNKWERTQVVGLGSVLITTVAFAAAFTIPGGYNQDHGTPVLGRKYIFRAFIMADALAFIQGSISLFALLLTTLNNRFNSAIPFAAILFVLALSSMVVAFGLGFYVTFAPVCYPIAVLVLVITLLLASPVGFCLIASTQIFLIARPGSNAFIYQGMVSFVMSFLIIFCLALL